MVISLLNIFVDIAYNNTLFYYLILWPNFILFYITKSECNTFYFIRYTSRKFCICKSSYYNNCRYYFD